MNEHLADGYGGIDGQKKGGEKESGNNLEKGEGGEGEGVGFFTRVAGGAANDYARDIMQTSDCI